MYLGHVNTALKSDLTSKSSPFNTVMEQYGRTRSEIIILIPDIQKLALQSL